MSIVCKNLFFSYKKNKNQPYLFQDMTFELHNNEVVCIYGRTGSGKTTLFNVLFEEFKPHKGKIIVDSIPFHNEKHLKNKISFLFQEPEKQFVFPSIKDEYHFILSNYDDNSISQKISEICNLFNVKIEDYFNRNIYELSPGELRIFQIAFCFSSQTPYYILDEPAQYLENEFEATLFTMIKSMNNRGILILTKYPELYSSIAQRSIPINMLSA